MRDSTRKLSGPAKDKFFERLYATEEGVDRATAERLTRRSGETFSSVHVREKAYAAVRRARVPAGPGKEAPAPQPSAAQPLPTTATPAEPPPPSPAREQPTAQAKPFDPYAFGLVPLYQKEGREALLARLGAIDTADHLRQLARAQQVSVPQAMRTGEVPLDELRAAIADAVAKRIADRRAAAG